MDLFYSWNKRNQPQGPSFRTLGLWHVEGINFDPTFLGGCFSLLACIGFRTFYGRISDVLSTELMKKIGAVIAAQEKLTFLRST
jgi:hypothetical protein